MKHLFYRYMKSDDGASAVEFGIFMPIIAMLVVAMADFGFYLHHKMMMQELSRAAVEYIVQGGNESDIEANVFANSRVYQAAEASGREVETFTERSCECRNLVPVSCTSSCGTGDYLRTFYSVEVRSTYTPIVPYPGLPESVEIMGTSTMEYNG
jgi:Flp pilus assembly protein TadG